MSVALNLPSWRSSPPTKPSEGSLDKIIERLSVCETAELDADRTEEETSVKKNSTTICNVSESFAEGEIKGCKCNNNVNEYSVDKNDGYEVSCACSKKDKINKPRMRNAKQLKKRRKKKKGLGRKYRNLEKGDVCHPLTKITGENISSGISNEHNLATVGGDGEENESERLRCRQHELNPSSDEINRPDVITSCDLTSNSVIKSDEENDQNKTGKKDCPGSRMGSCSTSQSTCSEGSYSRRKHHKHHKHKQKSKSPVRSEEAISPKVNPIFLWVRQEDTRIVEVLCEDYDHRNRLRLTRTSLGWRAIPKTKRFAEVIIPKATPKEEEEEGENGGKPKQAKKVMKRRKSKKRKSLVQKVILDNPNQIKECSVALSRDDLANYKTKTLVNDNVSKSQGTDGQSTSSVDQPSMCGLDFESNQSSPSSQSIDILPETLKRSKTMIKSSSCDFPSLTKALESLPRSISLDLNLKRDNDDFKVQRETREVAKPGGDPKEILLGVKREPEIEKDVIARVLDVQEESGNESEELMNQRNHSEPVVMDMTKHDSDFADCDELGQLLKDIPDLEFVEEEELEEVDEDEWSTPTDLTLPKSTEDKTSAIKFPILPANISPLVTVTSSVRPPEPLTAPLPEVTITPIPNPKPAHQQKPQNNFLESLLSSTHGVKPENEDFAHRRPFSITQCERKKHCHENDSDSEAKSKKLKVEDITLKNLLSKNKSNRTIKSLDLETCVQNLKMMEGEDCSKSRLQELLTDGISSGKADPISQLKEVLSNPHLAVPDPLLVPRARLPALVASPASEIPRLLSMHLEKAIEETPCPPVTDSDVLEVSLSNLQSLLSCSPEKIKSANAQDLAYYQKSLETFLEWQRYQTELMEAQMKNSKQLQPGFAGDMTDMAAAFGQMLWLPYLNQFDFNCNSNRDIMSLMNSMVSNDYQSNSNKLIPPQINISQVPQPSPFLTPTSPMDIESQLKTLAMWQEAVMMQQQQQHPAASRACPSRTPTQRPSTKVPNMPHPTVKKQQPSSRGTTISPVSSRDPKNPFEMYQDLQITPSEFQKKQNRQNSFQQRLEEHQKQIELQQKYKQEQQSQFRKMQRSYANYQAELSRQCKANERKKSGPVPGSISVKPLSNLIDKSNVLGESKSSWEQFEEELKKNAELSRLQAFKTLQHVQRSKVKEEKGCEWMSQEHKSKPGSEKRGSVEVKTNVTTPTTTTDTPKLKVKNLVDPNMSPPKLLKQIAPEHLPIVMDEPAPMQDDAQAHLWHPLFGSNQIKTQPYNSPWRWTTVTVNGE